MTERRSRFSRTVVVPGTVLTERDAALILACYRHQWLTRQQLQLLFGMGVTRINQRLRQLYDSRFLDRLRAGTVGVGMQPVYVAAEAAVPLLSRSTDLPEAQIREHLREDARASAVLLPHDLQVNDVRIALTRAIDGHPGLRLDLWLNTRESYDAFAPGRVLRPDGYFRFWQGDVLFSFYLEVDRGTCNLPRWEAKVERYQEYREDGHYTARHGLSRFRVLVAAPSAARLENLRAATAKVVSRSFWFALTGELGAIAGVAAPIWLPLSGTAPRPLIESSGE
ncbi:MAG: replication-relaxation family protein [Armatimonadota bacterium]